ncbi:MAG: ATP-binding cassette domain-containing protein [Clostridium sp.]|nr:ATP-binding cassette domain-containing protein [Clostridium sp.]
MSEIIFTARHIVKQYGKTVALNKFSMDIPRGSIYGFVGGNGAGKTTLMRILSGRIKQTSGEIELFGEGGEKEVCAQRRQIGALIEMPALYLNMTARDNLEVLRLQQGTVGTNCIMEALKIVGLADVGMKKVKDFSFGMKQRMGLAMALMGKKKFLVLDEPVNGLDPEGMIELRETLKRLNQEHGITILISSHLLSELNQLATCYGFIHKGKMLEQIAAEELEEKCRNCLSIFVDDAKKAMVILQRRFPQNELKMVTEHKIYLYGFSGDTGAITEALVTGNVSVKEIKVRANGLETYYMSLIKGERV